MKKLVHKNLFYDMEQLRGENSFMIIGIFSRQAREQGWTVEEIKTVTSEAMSHDYEHLCAVIETHLRSTQKDTKQLIRYGFSDLVLDATIEIPKYVTIYDEHGKHLGEIESYFIEEEE